MGEPGVDVNIAFLSRGHGFGHAARDLLVIEALRARRPGVTVDLMSSGSGLEYYRARSVPCTDMGIPDDEDMSEAAKWTVWRHLAKTPSPWDLVVTDEVVWALPFADRILRVPVVALTDWFFADFGAPQHDRLFDSADEVIVLDFEQSHPQAPRTAAPVHFAGPVVREFGARREQARAALGIAEDEFVAVLTLGGMPDRPEAVRMLNCVLGGWRAEPEPSCRLYVLGELSAQTIRSLPALPGGVVLVGGTPTPDRYYCAADVTLADAMGFTGCELAFNGRRAIGLVDAEAVPRFPESFRNRLVHLRAQGWIETAPTSCDPAELWRLITRDRVGAAVAGAGAGAAAPVGLPAADLDGLAARILRHAKGGKDDRSE